jgi:hypothetical protein
MSSPARSKRPQGASRMTRADQAARRAGKPVKGSRETVTCRLPATRLRKYHNRLINAAAVIRAMSEIRRGLEAADERASELGLTAKKVAFHDAIVEHAGGVYQHIFLRDLVLDAVQAIRANLKVGWAEAHREDVKAGGRRLGRCLIASLSTPRPNGEPTLSPPRPFAIALLLAAALVLPAVAVAAGVHVGSDVTVAEVTPIADILASPADHAGKVVRLEGEVSGVCTARGCWMEIGDEAGHHIRVAVEDGVLVFPSDATGKPAVAQGKVVVQEVSRERYVEWRQHLAGEGGEAFDEAKVGDGPYRIVEIAGTGATIGH